MLQTIDERKTEINRLCRQYQVARLELFGSATTDEFDPASSDLDFFVQFIALEPSQKADAYFGLLHGLEDLFGRKVDLVTREAANNRWFQQSVDSQRELLYAA